MVHPPKVVHPVVYWISVMTTVQDVPGSILAEDHISIIKVVSKYYQRDKRYCNLDMNT